MARHTAKSHKIRKVEILVIQILILMSVLYHNDTIMKKEKEFFIICLCTSHASIMIFFSKSFSHLSLKNHLTDKIGLVSLQ